MAPLAGGLFFGGTEPLEQDGAENEAGDRIHGITGFSYESDAEGDITYENVQSGGNGRKRKHSESMQLGEPGNGIHASRRKFATPKKATEKRKQEDDLILSLKDQKYSSQAVADRLVDSGLPRYEEKTITSRYARLCKTRSREHEDRLDDELYDWDIREDGKLRETINVIEERFELEFKKLTERKWKEAAEELAKRVGSKKYTGKACKERFEGLEDGSALKAIDVDSDQEGRTEMREIRIAESKRLRALAKEEAEQAKAKDDEARNLKKVLKRQQAEEKLRALEEKAAEAAENKRIKEEKKRGKELARANREKAEDALRSQRADRAQKASIEKALIRKYGGKARKPRCSTKKTTKTTRKIAQDLDDDEIIPDVKDESDDNAFSEIEVAARRADKPKQRIIADVSAETLLDPRTIMSQAELELYLFERGLARQGYGETHPQLIARLRANDEELSTSELDSVMEPLFLTRKGKREAKLLRLWTEEADNSEAGKKGVKSTDLAFKKRYEGYAGKFKHLIEGL